MATHLDVCTLDVWGNEDDGFEVNCAYRSGVTLLPGMDDDYYYRELRNYFEHLPPFEIEWLDDSFADVICRKTGRPLLQVQAAY